MRPFPGNGHTPRALSPLALALLLGGCGQAGYLYLVMPPTRFPPITRHPAPVPAAATVALAPCVSVPAPGTDVAPVAAPFGGTSVEQVPYRGPAPIAPTPAPSSLTDVLPACADFPDIITPTITEDAPPYP